MSTLKILQNSSRLLCSVHGKLSVVSCGRNFVPALNMSSQIAPKTSGSDQPIATAQQGKPLQGTTTGSGSSSGGSSAGGRPKSAGGRTKIFAFAALTGVAGGVAYSLYNAKNEAEDKKVLRQIGNAAEANIKPFKLNQRPPDFPVAKHIKGSKDNRGLKLTLYQYATCPFCCKARAFLNFMGLSYDIIEVNSVMRTQVKWSQYKKVPILVAETAEGDILQLNDSSMIVSAMFSYLQDPTAKSLSEYLAMYPQIKYMDNDGKVKVDMTNKYFIMFNEVDVQKRKETVSQERKWRQWVDNTFVHTLSPNVYRTFGESLEAFKWFSEVGNWEEHFATWERLLVIYVGSLAMLLIGKRLKKRHGLKDDVRQSFYDETNNWLKAVKQKGGVFLGGDEPNLADLAVYGCLSAIEGCEAFLDLQANTNIKPWYEAMSKAIAANSGTMVKI